MQPLKKMECERTCELSFLPLMPGALDEDDMDEFREDGIINAVGEASGSSFLSLVIF